MSRPFPQLKYPIIGAPLAGGPSTPALAAAVSNAGGLGFVAAGYLTADALTRQIDETRSLTNAPFGVNIFVIGDAEVDAEALRAYVERLRGEAESHGVELGEPRFEDDGFEGKAELVIAERIPVVSFTFGCPPPETIARLHGAGMSVWVTVTEASEAQIAANAGADALVVQGVEAGGHRGSFTDVDGVGEVPLRQLLGAVRGVTDLPLVAAGGIMDGASLAAAIAAGAIAGQLGTALMLTPEAATSPAQREAFGRGGATALTRAFTGRKARGIVNRFMTEHGDHAPSAYPQIHHVTAPLRKAAREQGDAEVINLWAGQGFPLAQPNPAGEIVRRIGEDTRALLAGR